MIRMNRGNDTTATAVVRKALPQANRSGSQPRGLIARLPPKARAMLAPATLQSNYFGCHFGNNSSTAHWLSVNRRNP